MSGGAFDDVVARMQQRGAERRAALDTPDTEMRRYTGAALRELLAENPSGSPLYQRASLEIQRRKLAADEKGPAPAAPGPAPAAAPGRRRRAEADYYAYVTRAVIRLFSHHIPKSLTATDLLVFLDLLTRKRKGTNIVEASMNQLAKSLGKAKLTVQRSRARLEREGLLTYECTERSKGTWDLGPGLEAANRLAAGTPQAPPDELPARAAPPHPDLPF